MISILRKQPCPKNIIKLKHRRKNREERIRFLTTFNKIKTIAAAAAKTKQPRDGFLLTSPTQPLRQAFDFWGGNKIVI